MSSASIGQIPVIQTYQSQFCRDEHKVHILDWALGYISSALAIDLSAISLDEISSACFSQEESESSFLNLLGFFVLIGAI